MKKFELPDLPYSYDALEPYISKQIMELHHKKHHLAYVNGANAAVDKLENSRKGKAEIDIKATLRDLSFNLSGHLLHKVFWQNMAPPSKSGGETPGGEVGDRIDENFGSFEAFKKEFSSAAKSVEGSGWAALILEPTSERLFVIQIEKHNLLSLPRQKPILVLDVWEHAYYLQYLNDRAKYVDNFWSIINWDDVSKRLEKCSNK
ncbi:MAG: superoxide dismutase [Candidatus Anstonellales archaeon]